VYTKSQTHAQKRVREMVKDNEGEVSGRPTTTWFWLRLKDVAQEQREEREGETHLR